jgi:hypothetical protein
MLYIHSRHGVCRRELKTGIRHKQTLLIQFNLNLLILILKMFVHIVIDTSYHRIRISNKLLLLALAFRTYLYVVRTLQHNREWDLQWSINRPTCARSKVARRDWRERTLFNCQLVPHFRLLVTIGNQIAQWQLILCLIFCVLEAIWRSITRGWYM